MNAIQHRHNLRDRLGRFRSRPWSKRDERGRFRKRWKAPRLATLNVYQYRYSGAAGR